MRRYLKQFLFLLGIVGVSLVVSNDSFAAGDAKAGKAVYNTHCALCHGQDGNSPMAAMGVPNFAKGERMDKPADVRYQSVCKGLTPPPPTPQMPAFCGKLSEAEIQNAIAYTETLKKGR